MSVNKAVRDANVNAHGFSGTPFHQAAANAASSGFHAVLDSMRKGGSDVPELHLAQSMHTGPPEFTQPVFFDRLEIQCDDGVDMTVHDGILIVYKSHFAIQSKAHAYSTTTATEGWTSEDFTVNTRLTKSSVVLSLDRRKVVSAW